MDAKDDPCSRLARAWVLMIEGNSMADGDAIAAEAVGHFGRDGTQAEQQGRFSSAPLRVRRRACWLAKGRDYLVIGMFFIISLAIISASLSDIGYLAG